MLAPNGKSSPRRFPPAGCAWAFHEPQGRAGCPQPAGRGAVRTPRPTGWREFMVLMHAQMRKGALHEPQGRADCPQPAEPWRGEDTAPYQLAWFMVPMHAEKKRKGAFHEPQGRAGCSQPAGRGAVRTPRPTSWRGFMVPLHGVKVVDLHRIDVGNGDAVLPRLSVHVALMICFCN